MAFYVDSSALVKLVVVESETDALRAWINDCETALVTSDLGRAELFRAVRRGAPDRLVAARAVLDGLTLLEIPPAIFETAGRLEPDDLRTLDALHLASALDLGDELDGIVTYDERLARASEANGVSVVAPS